VIARVGWVAVLYVDGLSDDAVEAVSGALNECKFNKETALRC